MNEKNEEMNKFDEEMWLGLKNGDIKLERIIKYLDTKEKLIKAKEIVDWNELTDSETVMFVSKFYMNDGFKESYELLKKHYEDKTKIGNVTAFLLLDELIGLQEAIDMKKEIKMKDKKSNNLKF